MSRLERRLLLSVIALFVVPAALGSLILLAAYRAGVFDSGAWSLRDSPPGRRCSSSWPMPPIAAYGLARSLLHTVETIRHGTELMTTVNPDYRVSVRPGSELETLARDINRLADQLRDARDALADSVGLPARARLHDLVDLDLMSIAGREGGQPASAV